MSEPITQAQDHDRRIGRLEGIAEQLTEQNRQTNAHLDRIEQGIAQVRQDMRQDVAAVHRRLETIESNHRRDFRWLIGLQLTTLLALGTLILSRLPG